MSANESIENPIYDDEWRLLRLLRCLSPSEPSEVRREVSYRAMGKYLPDKSIWDFMPRTLNVKPEGPEYMHELYSSSHVIYSAMEAKGDGSVFLLGLSVCDDEVIPLFLYEVNKIAFEQGRWSNYDEDFAKGYLKDWRCEIVSACENSEKNSNESPDRK